MLAGMWVLLECGIRMRCNGYGCLQVAGPTPTICGAGGLSRYSGLGSGSCDRVSRTRHGEGEGALET
jgi:hypothetical protein